MQIRRVAPVASVLLAAVFGIACSKQIGKTLGLPGKETPGAQKTRFNSFDQQISSNSTRLFTEGQRVFRYETFGSEDFFGGQLGLHKAIGGENGAIDGIGKGITPKDALAVGLKVDIEMVG